MGPEVKFQQFSILAAAAAAGAYRRCRPEPCRRCPDGRKLRPPAAAAAANIYLLGMYFFRYVLRLQLINYAQLYKCTDVCGCTLLYAVVRRCRLLYVVVRRCTPLYTIVRHSFLLYAIVHRCMPLYADELFY